MEMDKQVVLSTIATLAEIIRELNSEIARLKRGEFTPEEFQNLCHHLDKTPWCTRQNFEEGCRQYQERLFGKEQP